jgi:chromate transport protein ChrA
VAAVAVQAGWSLLAPSWAKARARARWVVYALLGAIAAATVGPWLVLVLLGCGLIELIVQRRGIALVLSPLAAAPAGGLLAVAWVAFKVGALSYGGGFVIVPLMQADAVDRYGWLTPTQFVNAVALGQVTPGPVVHTVAAVGYGADGLAGGLLAALVAFTPVRVVLAGGSRFDAIRAVPRARSTRRAGRDRRHPRPVHWRALTNRGRWQRSGQGTLRAPAGVVLTPFPPEPSAGSSPWRGLPRRGPNEPGGAPVHTSLGGLETGFSAGGTLRSGSTNAGKPVPGALARRPVGRIVRPVLSARRGRGTGRRRRSSDRRRGAPCRRTSRRTCNCQRCARLQIPQVDVELAAGAARARRDLTRRSPKWSAQPLSLSRARAPES